MKITALTLPTFIVGAIIGGFYGDALGIRSATESRTVETLEATVATQKKTLATKDATIAELTKANEARAAIVAAQADTIAILQVRVREADPPAIPFEFEAPE